MGWVEWLLWTVIALTVGVGIDRAGEAAWPWSGIGWADVWPWWATAAGAYLWLCVRARAWGILWGASGILLLLLLISSRDGVTP